jgi:hypothetical protein
VMGRAELLGLTGVSRNGWWLARTASLCTPGHEASKELGIIAAHSQLKLLRQVPMGQDTDAICEYK